MELGLHGKVALVTGASQGLGAAIAVALAREGVRQCLTARNRANLEAVAEALPVESLVFDGDLSQPEAVVAAVEATQARFGRLDLLVNNAGATKREDFFGLTDQDWQESFALKFHGYIRFTRAAWPLLRQSQGSIINIVGIGARTGKGEFTIGGSVNAGLLNFTKAMSEYGIRDGVRVNAINPGRIATDRLSRHLERFGREHQLTPEAAAARLREELGIARFGGDRRSGRLHGVRPRLLPAGCHRRHRRRRIPRPVTEVRKSFLLLFFKKEDLPFLRQMGIEL
jgi:NAD(P)-dependent dehydrogenase (short-subunit alcohol dehydrogenase family)